MAQYIRRKQMRMQQRPGNINEPLHIGSDYYVDIIGGTGITRTINPIRLTTS